MGCGLNDNSIASEFTADSSYSGNADELQKAFDEISVNLYDMIENIACYTAYEGNPCVYADRYIVNAADNLYLASDIKLPGYIDPSSYMYVRLMMDYLICRDSVYFYGTLICKSNEARDCCIECDARHFKFDRSMVEIADKRIAAIIEYAAYYLASEYGKATRRGCYDIVEKITAIR